MEPKYNGTITKFIITLTKAIIAGERAVVNSLFDNKESIFPPLAELAEASHTARAMLSHFHSKELGAVAKPHEGYMAGIAPATMWTPVNPDSDEDEPKKGI